jgi:CRISPR-associated protein Cas5d
MRNIVEFCVHGRYALFTDPITKIGGEKFSYQIPTYEALKGIMSSVYWKPTFIWIIDEVRVMKPIRTEARNMRPLVDDETNTLAIYTYLSDVAYQVRAHFEWNHHREDLAQDRNENKHYFIAKRMIERGGRRDVFLGARECQGYVEPCRFGEGEGFYDNYGTLGFDLMFHGFDYPDELGKNEFRSRFWRPRMENGVIKFPKPDKCEIVKFIRNMSANPPSSSGLKEESLLGILNERKASDELDSATR